MGTQGADEFPELGLITFLSAVAWGVGTNWLGDWYYPVRGIGWGDLLFFGWCVFALLEARRRQLLAVALWEVRKFILLVLAFMTWLLISTAVNCYWLGAGPTDVLAIVRLMYSALIVLFAYAVVRRVGYGMAVTGFIVGVALITLERFYDAGASGASAIVLNSVVILKDPNVTGNMIGMAVLFCSLAIMLGYLKLSMTAALLFAAASISTFSKGTWLMVLLGLMANGIAWVMLYRRTHRSFLRFVPLSVVLLVAVGGVIYRNSDLLLDLINFKLETTAQSETANYRYQFGLAAIDAMSDNPVFGLGLRNFPQVERLYPDVVPEPTENAHNAFLQYGAVGGLPALALLLAIFVYPFAPLRRVLRAQASGPLAAAYTALLFLIMFLSGSVQLQLVAQPFFWLFAGIVFGWHARMLARPL